MHLSDKQREDAFPIHIKLGQQEDGRVSYPVAYLGDVAGIDQLPEEGCALVHFKKGEDGSVEMHRICLAEGGGEDDEDAPTDLYEALRGPVKASEKTDDSDDDGEE